MARERICGVYKITSPSGGFYIGSSRDIHKRLNEHKSALKRGNHCNTILQNAAKKYGVDDFKTEILELCTHDNVRDIEQKYIDELNPNYNLARDVVAPLSVLWASEEFRKRNSEKATEQNKKWWSIPENKEKAKGRVLAMLTPEIKKKAKENRKKSMALRGDVYLRVTKASSEKFKKMHADPEFAKLHSERMRGVMLERCKNKDFCKKRDEAAAKANRKPIKLLNTGDTFPSMQDAADILNMSVQVIRKQLKGLSTRTGYRWEFVGNG